MARQSKHLRFQVAHKAAQMMAEEGINDYAFKNVKLLNFLGFKMGMRYLQMMKSMMQSKSIKRSILMKSMKRVLKY